MYGIIVRVSLSRHSLANPPRLPNEGLAGAFCVRGDLTLLRGAAMASAAKKPKAGHGRVVRVRTRRLPDGTILRVYVFEKKGPKGGSKETKVTERATVSKGTPTRITNTSNRTNTKR